jgi:hypothetical protein
MRSLWRILALQWLGGVGSEVLTAGSTVLEALVSGEYEPAKPSFTMRREPDVSHGAMMSPRAERGLDPEFVAIVRGCRK